MKTVILAGGFGTRLSEETHAIPKPMVNIGPHPILFHIMKIYATQGHTDFLIALGYKGDVIKRYFHDLYTLPDKIHFDFKNKRINKLDHSDLNWGVNLVHTGEDSMTGGRLLRLKNQLKNEDYFMMTYGDGVANIDINSLIDFHKKSNRIATITAVRPPARFGGLHMDEHGTVQHFEEKPQIGEGWINGGYMVFSPKIFDYIVDDSTILERDVFENLCKDQQLSAYKHSGFWQPMDTLRDKTSLDELWHSRKAKWKIWD